MPPDAGPFKLLRLLLSQQIEVAKRVLERDGAELAQRRLPDLALYRRVVELHRDARNGQEAGR